MNERMGLKERFYWIISFLLHGGGIGDVNIGKVPLWIMYPWFWCVLIWYHLPVVILRKTLNDLKQEKENGEYYIKYLNEEREKLKRSDSVIEQLELELRRQGQLHILRNIQNLVNDPDWEFPKYRYKSDHEREPYSSSWTPVLKHRSKE